MNINQYNEEGKPHGYWHEYHFTLLGCEYYQSGVYNNGVMVGGWTESKWTREHKLLTDNHTYLESGIFEGENINFNY